MKTVDHNTIIPSSSYLPPVSRWGNITSQQGVARSGGRVNGSQDIIAALEGLFGADGTQDFLKDNLFEVF